MQNQQKGSSNIVLAVVLTILVLLLAWIIFFEKFAPVSNDEVTDSEIAIIAAPFRSPKDWSIKLVDLFKQAVNEKYGVGSEILDKNLLIIGVGKGNEADGNVLTPPAKGRAVISYLYRINWSYFSGANENALNFVIEDSSGATLSDEDIIENIKQNLSPVFAVKDIISEKSARSICKTKSTEELSPELKPYFYNQNNHIRYDASKNDLVLECFQTISEEDNKCNRIFLSLKTGKEILNQRTACSVY